MKARTLALCGLLLALSCAPLSAQQVTKICVPNTTNSGCTPVDANNPLPVTGGGGGGGGNDAASATGAAVPAKADYQGLNVGGTLRGQTAVNPTGSVYAGQTDLSSVNGVTALTGAGAVGTGSPRVAVGQDTTTIAGASPTATGIYVTGPAAAALATSALQTTGNSSAATTATGVGAPADTAYAGSGSASVIAAAKGIYAAATSPIPAGTNLIGKVGIDQTTPGTTNAVQNIAGTTGGVTPFTLTAAASTNATNVKATPGTLYHISGFAITATPAWISFYNTAGTPTCGTGIVYQTLIPGNTAGSGAAFDIAVGMNFSTGIGICITTGIAGTGSVAATSYVVNLGFK